MAPVNDENSSPKEHINIFCHAVNSNQSCCQSKLLTDSHTDTADIAGSEDNLQNEEGSSRKRGQQLTKHISLEQPRQPMSPSPSAAPDWVAMSLQLQRLQVPLQITMKGILAAPPFDAEDRLCKAVQPSGY